MLTDLLEDQDSSAILDISTKQYKWRERRRNLNCWFCQPHQSENESRNKAKRKKKEWQLDPKRKFINPARRRSGISSLKPSELIC